jgi:hypothetical protein
MTTPAGVTTFTLRIAGRAFITNELPTLGRFEVHKVTLEESCHLRQIPLACAAAHTSVDLCAALP